VHHKGGGAGRKKEREETRASQEGERETQSPPNPQPSHPAEEREARERRGWGRRREWKADRPGSDNGRRETAPGLEKDQAKEAEDTPRNA
jgi:hypothetical protein